MKRWLKKLLPARLRRCLRSPYVLPGDYRSRLERYEQTALGDFGTDRHSQIAQLRQYAHELDKGLHRQDWEPGHGAAVYEQARCLYARLAPETAVGGGGVLGWVRGILYEYESRRARAAADVVPLAVPVAGDGLSPDDVARAIEARVSSRWYRKEPVSRDSLERIVQAALHAPSSCNRQTLRVFASLDPARTSEILKCFKGFTGFSPYVPCALVFGVDLRPYLFPRELFIPTLDTALAVENALLMASALGLSATLLTWGSRNADDERRLRLLLDVPDYVEIVVGAACGHPERNAVRPVRKSVSETLVLK